MYNTYGDYDIVINSIDRAGNTGVSELHFKYVKPKSISMVKPLNNNKLKSERKPEVAVIMTVILGSILILTAIKFYKRNKKTTNKKTTKKSNTSKNKPKTTTKSSSTAKKKPATSSKKATTNKKKTTSSKKKPSTKKKTTNNKKKTSKK